MKKVGILTFHASHNNGSMLQAIALQNVLKNDYSLDAEIINFSNDAQRNMYSIMPKADKLKRIIRNAVWMTNYKEIKKQYYEFDDFMKNNMVLSDKDYHVCNELSRVADDYRAIIVGSDQVWNIKCVDADDAYFISFSEDIPRYAYAVSFGANNPFIVDKKYVDYIKKFKMISVRENNGKKWIKNASGLDVELTSDPTLLVDIDEWEDLIKVGDPIISDDYIFYYCFSITEDVQRFLAYVSKKYNMPVYFSEAKEWALKTCWRNKIKRVGRYGPDVYLNLVKHSKMFITTSFHGIAFSMLYHKCFWYIDRGNNDPDKDDRAITLLNQLDLMDRYRSIDYLKEVDLYIEHDYSESDLRLYELRNKSRQYLNTMVNCINGETE